jgi:putative oxidoreductase
MKDLRQPSEQGYSSRFTFLDRASVTRWAPIPLRLIVGYGFMQHGFAKLSRGPDAFAVVLHAIGVPAPHLMAWLTTLIEIFGGLAVLLGALIPLACLPMAALLLVAIFTVHLPYGFSSIKLMSVTAVVPNSGLQATNATCSISPVSRRSSSAVLDRWR